MQYQLNLGFTNEQLETFYAAGVNVIIAKPSASEGNPDIAWLAVKPLQSNTITWEEEYGIYASTQGLVHGANITKLSLVKPPAADNKHYVLEQSGAIEGPIPPPPGQPGSFVLINKYQAQPYMMVGLYQSANVDGNTILNSAISGALVIPMATSQMTPYTTIYVWLQSNVKGNSVCTTVTSPMTKLTYGGGVDGYSIVYDSSTGKFTNSPATQALGKIEHVLPALN